MTYLSTGIPTALPATPSCAELQVGKAYRKRTLAALSLALLLALCCIALIIGSSTSQAAVMPAFTPANALAAKQSAGVASMATASLAIIAFGALAVFSTRKKT